MTIQSNEKKSQINMVALRSKENRMRFERSIVDKRYDVRSNQNRRKKKWYEQSNTKHQIYRTRKDRKKTD